MGNFLDNLIGLFFPPLCLLCSKFITSGSLKYFCRECYSDFSFNMGPQCPQCGLPFISGEGEDHLCRRCMDWHPSFDKARAIGIYKRNMRKAIHMFKYDSKSLLGKPLGKLLSKYAFLCGINPDEYDCLVPVPLHPARLRQRGFNQSLHLARQAGKMWGITVDSEGLQRIHPTKPQTRLKGKERLFNVRGAFSYKGDCIKRKAVLLIDDVYTSGSTVNECARVLKKNGAIRVDVLTLARTP